MRQLWATVAVVLATCTCAVAACRGGPRQTLLVGSAAPPGESRPGASGAPGSAPQEAVSAQSRVHVVATFSILGDWVRNVGGSVIDLHVLVGPDGDVHAFEPNPVDGVALAGAALVFENGLNLEPWMDDLYAASGSTARRVEVTDGLTPRSLVSGEYDPHMWQDVSAAEHMIRAIGEGLAVTDLESAVTYRANATAYAERLATVDRQIEETTLLLFPGRRKLVTSHDALGYFARRYGYEIVATALGAASTEAADPSAAGMARLVDQIRAAGVPAIFAENVAHSDLMERIAQEAGVELVDTLYTDALGEPGTPGDTYIGMMSYNIATIVGALSPAAGARWP